MGLVHDSKGKLSETGVPDIFSYFRRREAAEESTPFGGDEAIDLETMGGAIDTVYRDIASVSAPAEKARPKSSSPPPASPRPQRQAAPPEQRDGQGAMHGSMQGSVQASAQGSAPAQGRSDVPIQARAQIPPQRPATRASQRPPARPRRRSDGNGAAPPERKALLSVHSVEKSFVGRKVVRGVSLYVRKGEAVGLLGPNGAGKTTVFYMITGLIKADEGRIELDGFDVTHLPMYQRARLGIGYLPQEASIFRGLTVEENIRAVLEVVEPDGKRRERDLDALLEEFNIARLRKTAAIALSGGERRRVEIARALATRPNYMLLDEPFAGIDPIAVGDIQALVRHLTNRGIGVLITDHNVRETLGLTDRAYIIYSGEVLMEGRADDIVNNPDVRRLYLGEEFRL
jgi:lipopolysaccharide export system ATP-binding protein